MVREIDRSEVERTVVSPEFVVPSIEGKDIYMRRYFDAVLQKRMLLRVVVKKTGREKIIITVYKTSHISRHLRGLT